MWSKEKSLGLKYLQSHRCFPVKLKKKLISSRHCIGFVATGRSKINLVGWGK